MAVYDKSGFSHSETSLVAVVYLSRQVRPSRARPWQQGSAPWRLRPDSGHPLSRTKL